MSFEYIFRYILNSKSNIFNYKLDTPLLVIMAKWPRFGFGKSRLSKDIGKNRALRIQQKMLDHTLNVARYLKDHELVEVSLAMSGIGLKHSRRICNKLGIKNYHLQGKGCLGEKMRRQIQYNFKYSYKYKKKDIIIIGSDLPNLCHIDVLLAISKLKSNDIVLGPSNDGGYWLIAFSRKFISYNFFTPFIDIKWGKNDVLEKTIAKLKKEHAKIYYLNTKIDIDTISDIHKRY